MPENPRDTSTHDSRCGRGTDGSGAGTKAETHLTTMTSESDGVASMETVTSAAAPASAALVLTIRDRIVEYKELLLRQLLDQRVALLAIENVSDDAKKKDEDIKVANDEEVVVQDEPQDVAAVPSTMVADETGVAKDVEMDDGKREAEDDDRLIDTNGHEDVHAEIAADSDRKRSASEVEGSVRTDVEVHVAKIPSCSPAAERELSKRHPIVHAAKRMRSASTVGELLQHSHRVVVRTSTPPRHYLEQKDHDDEGNTEEDSSAPLILRSPRQPKLTTRPHARSSSIDEINADFERKLSVTMRLHREVGRRSVTMTRKRQLPRLPTPGRLKSHWDYLLEEMRWMATDFSQERNWKRLIQFHLAKEVVVAQNAERVRRETKNRQRARDIAQQVSAFWRTIERIAARSRVRFESGSGGSFGKDSDLPGSKVNAADVKGEDVLDGSAEPGSSSLVILKFKRVEVTSTDRSDEVVKQVDDVKQRIQQIVTAGKKARTLLSPSVDHRSLHPRRDEALLELQSSSAVLTAFQIVALRWMMDLFFSGFNCLLNDQLGMGKAATIAAFLRVIEILQPSEIPLEVSRPHLLVVPREEMHKWSFYLRRFNPDAGVIQLYWGTAQNRRRLQREWTKKLNVRHFMSADDVEELEKEDATPMFACICDIAMFNEDKKAFLEYGNWQTLVVEKEHDSLFDDEESIGALKQIKQKQRRILCCGQPLEAWSSSKIRTEFAEFLLRDEYDDQNLWSLDAWAKLTILEKSSALEMVKSFGRTGSSLLKAQQDQLSAILLALYALSLRRVRSEVESQLGKLEEQSIACTLTHSQKRQYRSAVTGFAASISDREDRIEVWLQLFLRLRGICSCVDLLNDSDKLALADLKFLFSSSGKLQALNELLSRLLEKEDRRVVVYCQLDSMFPVLEMLLALMDVTYVRITGQTDSQHRALCHFALKPAVKVALASTRLATLEGKRSMPVYGVDAIVVFDSDWNAACDAKLRASWANLTLGREVPVYRLHCDDTIEAALLRGGSCFTEKVFGEMSPLEVVASAAGDALGSKVDKPTWWSPNSPYTSAVRLSEIMQQVEEAEKFCGTEVDISSSLRVVNVELDAEEHLLLANADELTPVEWYAVNYVHNVTEKKRHDSDTTVGVDDEAAVILPQGTRSFEDIATAESRRQWKEIDAGKQLFYAADSTVSVSTVGGHREAAEVAFQRVLRDFRDKGIDPYYDMLAPPKFPTMSELVESEPGLAEANQMMFHVSYRVPAPPAPPPVVKAKADVGAHVLGDSSLKPIKVKKRKDLAVPGRPAGGAANGTTPGGSNGPVGAGVKRKLDQQGPNGKSTKEQRLDLDGIPLPDVTEFADDDFWGDTNLDALDSAAWDDPAVLSGILGPSLDSSPVPAGSSGSSGVKKKNKTGASSAGTSGTGRVRKGSISDKEGWTVQDDLILKKLFDLYGSNWTLIAQVFNTATSVSRFFYRKRSPRQCYDRYGKIISGSLGSSSSASASGSSNTSGSLAGTSTKDGKSSSGLTLKQQKLTAAAAAVWTPEVLAERIGIPAGEMLLAFVARDSLPGLPPPSIVNVPTLVELNLKKKKKQKQLTNESSSGLDDLKSIRSSFDAIIQSMKRKTSPPPIPIPQPASSASTDTTTTSVVVSATATSSPSKPRSIVTPPAAMIPPPHKSHLELVEVLPRVPLGPDDVIKRSKEAAAVAVQAAAAVASVRRDVSSMSSASDVMMGAAFGSAMSNKAQSVSLAAARVAAGAATTNLAHALPSSKLATSPGMSGSGTSWGDAPNVRPSVGHSNPSLSGNTANAISSVATAAAAGIAMGAGVGGASTSENGMAASRNPMPVTTSALLHVLDRMPEIKNKIQAILNRSDCSEAQKVAMIARLLSNTNAINATAVAAAATGNMNAAVSVTLGPASSAGVPSSSPIAAGFVAAAPVGSISTQSLNTPIPMPASLQTPSAVAASPSTLPASSSATTPSMAAVASALADPDLDGDSNSL